ncbi:MAG: ATP-binding protein [Anaerolineae bacterium]|jgi:signal transduction histidine kinase
MDAAPKQCGSLFDSVSVGLCAVDKDGNILRANPALHRLLRWNLEKWTGQPLSTYLQQAIVDPAQAVVWMMALSEALTLSKTTYLNLPARLRTKPGEDELENITGVAIATSQCAATEPWAVMAICGPDVTKSVEDVRVRLFSAVSHELGSPASNVAAAAALLAANTDDRDERQCRLVDVIRAEISRLQRLVAQLATDSPGLKKQPALAREVVTLRPLLQRVGQLFGLRNHRHRILLQAQPDLPFAWGNSDAIQQVLSNLVDNALRHSPPHSTITLTAEAEANRVRIGIVDEGPGVPVKERKRLFQPGIFAAPDGDGHGQGLGLSISMSLVRGMGGELWYEEQGQGAHCFCFTLPRVEGVQYEVEIGG